MLLFLYLHLLSSYGNVFSCIRAYNFIMSACAYKYGLVCVWNLMCARVRTYAQEEMISPPKGTPGLKSRTGKTTEIFKFSGWWIFLFMYFKWRSSNKQFYWLDLCAKDFSHSPGQLLHSGCPRDVSWTFPFLARSNLFTLSLFLHDKQCIFVTCKRYLIIFFYIS